MWILVVFGLLIVKLNNKSDKNTLFLYVNFDKDLKFNDIMDTDIISFIEDEERKIKVEHGNIIIYKDKSGNDNIEVKL